MKYFTYVRGEKCQEVRRKYNQAFNIFEEN